MVTPLTVLKLGGSVITNKKKKSTPSNRTISQIMKEISPDIAGSLVIVHGGGSYGHHLAKHYRLSEGYRDQSQILGFVKTRQSMMELNKIILHSAIENGLPCVSLQPSAFVETKNKRIEKIDTHIIADLLKLRMIPLLFGDVVLDQKLGFCVLSGDQLVSRLATELEAKQIVLTVDVVGVFDSDPRIDRKARLMEKMAAADIKKLIQKRGKSTQHPDVTGEMTGKLREMLPALKKGTRVIILNGRVPGRLSEALSGKTPVGTVIE